MWLSILKIEIDRQVKNRLISLRYTYRMNSVHRIWSSIFKTNRDRQ